MSLFLLAAFTVVGGAIVFGLSGFYAAHRNVRGLLYVGLSQIVIHIIQLILLNDVGISFGLGVLTFAFIVGASPIALMNWLIVRDNGNDLLNYAMLARYSLDMRRVSFLCMVLIPIVVLLFHDFRMIWPLLFRVEIYWLYVYSVFIKLIVAMLFLVPFANVAIVGFKNKTYGIPFLSNYDIETYKFSVFNKFTFFGLGSGTSRLFFAVICYIVLCVIYYK